MIRPLELQIGLRYTRAKRRNHFISFISLTSMFGIVLGVWALITVLSIMNGFEGELRDRILGVASHVTVSGQGGVLKDWRAANEVAVTHPNVKGASPYILGQGLLRKGQATTGGLLRGINPETESQVSELLPNKMVEGSFADLVPGQFGIILGQDLAWRLNAEVGAKVTVIAPNGNVTPAGFLPKFKRFTVVGIFDLGMYEYDSAMSLMHVQDLAALFKMRGQVSGIRLKLDDVYRSQTVRKELASALGPPYIVSDWTREHSNFFRALKVEKRVMFIILMLIISVAAFNIVSTLVMMVIDKQADIAILRTLGLSPGSVMSVFIIQGVIIGIIGTLLGAVLGVLTAINVETLVPAFERLLGIEFFPDDVYVISDFPAKLDWSDVTKVTLASLAMALIATIYPAWRASKTHPAEALRYE